MTTEPLPPADDDLSGALGGAGLTGAESTVSDEDAVDDDASTMLDEQAERSDAGHDAPVVEEQLPQ